MRPAPNNGFIGRSAHNDTDDPDPPAFTRALADVLGPEAHIVAVDKDAGALRAAGSGFETRVADFTRPLDLRDLDGVLMANSLHFVRDKEPVLKAVRGMLGDGGRLIVVEYGAEFFPGGSRV